MMQMERKARTRNFAIKDGENGIKAIRRKKSM